VQITVTHVSWAEGGNLEPDTVHKMAYLDAVRDVLAFAHRKGWVGDKRVYTLRRRNAKK